MIHLLTWIPHQYQQTLCRELQDSYDADFTVWFAEREHKDFPFKANEVADFSKQYLSETGYGKLFRALKADKDAVVILGGWRSPMTTRTLLITTLLQVPVFIWADHPHPRRRNLLTAAVRSAYLRLLNVVASGFLACGQPTREHLAALGLPRQKITNFPYWTELPSEWSAPLGAQIDSSRPLKLVTVGRLFPVKQIHVAIEAVAIANKKAGRTIAELMIAGDGPERSSLEAVANRLGVADCVKFLGWLESEETRGRIGESDALIITSSFEPYGVVVLEAMAAGRPVLASSTVIAAVDRDEGTGAILLHQQGDANALAEQITSFANDRQKLRDASLAARRTAEKWPPSRALDILGDALGRTKAGRQLIARRQQFGGREFVVANSSGAAQ